MAEGFPALVWFDLYIYFVYFVLQPLLQSLVSYKPSESIIICSFGAQETFLIITNVVLKTKAFI